MTIFRASKRIDNVCFTSPTNLTYSSGYSGIMTGREKRKWPDLYGRDISSFPSPPPRLHNLRAPPMTNIAGMHAPRVRASTVVGMRLLCLYFYWLCYSSMIKTFSDYAWGGLRLCPNYSVIAYICRRRIDVCFTLSGDVCMCARPSFSPRTKQWLISMCETTQPLLRRQKDRTHQ